MVQERQQSYRSDYTDAVSPASQIILTYAVADGLLADVDKRCQSQVVFRRSAVTALLGRAVNLMNWSSWCPVIQNRPD